MVGVRRGQRQQQRANVRQAAPIPTYGGAMPAYQEAGRALGGLGAAAGPAQEAMGLSRAAALGQGPSVAQEQLAAGRQAGLVQQMGLLNQQQGTGLASQQRQLAGMGAANQMGLARDTAALRAQEIAQARGELAAQAQAQQQMALQRHLAAQQAEQAMYGQQYQGQLEYGLGTRAQDIEALAGRRQYVRDVVGDVGRTGGAVAGSVLKAFFSDERLKDIESHDADDEALDAVRGLASVRYRYKNRRHGPTDRSTIGFTAQDLERSPAGRAVIHETPEGKAVDVPGSLSLALSGLAAVVREIDRMKGASHG